MKVILRWTAVLYLCCASTVAFAGKLPGGRGFNFLVGYNEAWFGPNYASSIASNPSVFCLPSSFDPSFVDKMFDGMQAGGAKIVRIWAFPVLQGIQLTYDGMNPVPCPIGGVFQDTPQTLGLKLKPEATGAGMEATKCLKPSDSCYELISNLEQVFLLAQKHHLMVYVTVLNGDDMVDAATNVTGLGPYFLNLITNTNGELDRFKTYALLPLLQLMNKYKDSKLPFPDSKLPVIYALDLMNEIDNAEDFAKVPPCNTSPDPFSCAIGVAREWIKNVTAFVKSKTTIPPATASWLPVTASAGNQTLVVNQSLVGNQTTAAYLIYNGLFSGLGLDFYDLHAYADYGLSPGLTTVCNSNTSDVPIILGEYGQSQKKPNFDNWLQFWTTYNFLITARSHCFSAALAWKYETICDPTIPGSDCPSRGYDWWTYLIPGPGRFGGTFRPAYFLIH